MARPAPRPTLPLFAVVVLAIALVQHADATTHGALVHRQFAPEVFGGNNPSGSSSSSSFSQSTTLPSSTSSSSSQGSPSSSSSVAPATSTSITLITPTPTSSLALNSSATDSTDSSGLSRSNSRSSRFSTSLLLTTSLDPLSTLSSSSSAIPLPTDSSDDKSDSKGVGLGKGTLITIAVIASIVGAISAIWTVVRKWKLSPSRRFEKKLSDVDPDFYEPRPPSFGEKPQYYNLGHRHDQSFGSATNFAGYGAGTGTVAEPAQAHAHHSGGSAAPAWASQNAVGRSNSGSSGPRPIGPHGGYDVVTSEPFSPQQMYAPEAYPGQAYPQVALHPGASGMGYDPSFRTASPGAPLRGPSPGYAQLPPNRAISPGYGAAGANVDSGLHRDHAAAFEPAAYHSEGPVGSEFGRQGTAHLPLPGGDNGGIVRTGTPGGLFQGAPGAPAASPYGGVQY